MSTSPESPTGWLKVLKTDGHIDICAVRDYSQFAARIRQVIGPLPEQAVEMNRRNGVLKSMTRKPQ